MLIEYLLCVFRCQVVRPDTMAFGFIIGVAALPRNTLFGNIYSTNFVALLNELIH